MFKTCLCVCLAFMIVTPPVWANSITVAPQANIAQVLETIKDPTNAIDTVVFKPGVYKLNSKSQALLLDQLQGSAQQPLIFKAEISGRTIIDGQNTHRCLHITNSKYLIISGFFVRNCHFGKTSEYASLNLGVPDPSIFATPVFIEQSEHITLSQITSYHSLDYGIDDHPFYIRAARYVLIENSAGYGHGRKTVNVDWNSRNVIIRNFFGYWQAYTSGDDWPTMLNFYGRPESLRWPGYKDGSQDRLGENIVLYVSPQATKDVRGPTLSGLRDTLLNVIIRGNDTTNNNQQFSFSGCRLCQMKHIVSIAGRQTEGHGVLVAQHRDPFLENVIESRLSNYTWIGSRSIQTIQGIHISTLQPLTSGQAFSLNVTNAFFQGNNQSNTVAWSRSSDSNGLITHKYNAFHQFLPGNIYGGNFPTWSGYSSKTSQQIMQEHQEQILDPQWNIATYGDGAYLMAVKTQLVGKGENGSPIGATVLYQYRTDWNTSNQAVSTLTTTPLWPWPLESRICAETARNAGGLQGVSVSFIGPYQLQYDGDGDGALETYTCSGGLWKTLTGVYPGNLPTPTPSPQPSPTPTACPLDSNGDGTLSLPDLVAVLTNWQGSTSLTKLLTILANWGQPCP